VGTLVALVAGFFVIGWLLRYLRTRTTYLFVAWRVAAGVIIALLLWQGVLPTSDEAPAPAPAHATEARTR
jgi:undecaprenyl-diphosphatase